MRGTLSVFVLGAVALMVGCASEDAGSLTRTASRGDGDTQGSGAAANNANAANTQSASVTACSGVAAPTSLSDAKDAQDVHLAGTAVFFQTGTTVQRILKNGGNKATVFTSENLVHTWVDKSALLLVERTDSENTNATLRTFAATVADPADDGAPAADAPFPSFPVDNTTGEDPGGTTTATNFNAASVTVFGSDDNNFYVSATDADGKAQIVQYAKGDLTATTLVTSDKVISSPQVTSGAVWYVEDNQRVWKVAFQDDDGDVDTTPKEVFGISYSQCNLAVDSSSAYCSVGTAIESRDLTGASPKTLMDATASKVSAPFGTAQYFSGELYVRNLSPAADVKNVLRTISTTDASEKFLACNRGQITGVAVDTDSVVWTEDGAGVFMTTH